MVKNRLNATVRDSSSWDGRSVTFKIDDPNIPAGLSLIRFNENSNRELYQQFVDRLKFDVDFSQVKTKKEAGQLKEEILAKCPASKEEDYNRTIEAYKKADDEYQQKCIIDQVAYAVTRDLGWSEVSDERYAHIVKYAKTLLKSVGTDTPLDAIKEEPRRNLIQRKLDGLKGREDALQETKKAIEEWKIEPRFPKGEKAQEIFGQMADNLPDERIKYYPVNAANVQTDPKLQAFRDIYRSQVSLALEERSKAWGDFVEEFVKAKIRQDVADDFGKRYKTHLAKIHAREQLLKRGKKPSEALKKAVKGKPNTVKINPNQKHSEGR